MRDNGRVNDAKSRVAGATEQGSRLYPRVTSFRSRRGALTDPQQQTWDRLWPTIGADVSDAPLDIAGWFGREAPTIVEIGSGTGTATAAMAKAEPHANLIAIEVYRPGLAQLLQAIERDSIPNIRVLRGDAVDVLENMLGPESLTGVRVFFPDPWPKARHHKRRLLQGPTFKLIAERLIPGGVLHVATDHAEYAEWIAEAGNAEPLLTPLDWDDLAQGPADSPMTHERPVTKFENKAQQVGRPITELIWGKVRA
ncbi:tRNA (guanosine(46)-N7)-methyltransferase TrmB [Rhodococcus maanshanensis]|uniref:tRNA (guanine-N(7)-)-methyltransferase n=1 Tax=Rhodococcus maanshanensis TaxID=183556 RepID=A0A1H7QR42_9NOCA|nr:tRNA (guanine-N7-)-methyltransferase [Rhodococcus maanshanensis]